MQTLFSTLVQKRKTVLLLFLFFLLLALPASRFVKVNNNLADYLPSDSDSTSAIRLMQEEFEGAIPNTSLMVKDISPEEAKELTDLLRTTEGILSVTWIRALDYGIPLSMLPESSILPAYKDNCALYQLALDETKTIALIDEIRELTGHDTAISGSFVNAKVVAANSAGEIFRVVALVVVFGLSVLLLTMDTWLEPVLLVLCLFASVMLNSGTNLILGTISAVTNTAASVLQMGVSFDYFIFILHRYKEIRKNTLLSPEEAMKQALSQSFLSVLSSALTTIIGFLALMFMRYRIGFDMGIVLAKGIVFSLLTAFTLMPCVILLCEKQIQKTGHQILIGSVGKLPQAAWRLRIPAACLFLLFMVPSSFLQHQNAFYYGTSHSYPDSHWVMEERKEIESVFGNANTIAILVPLGDDQAERQLLDTLTDTEGVASVTSYQSIFRSPLLTLFLSDQNKQEITSLLHSEHYSRLIVTLDADEESAETFALLDRIRSQVAACYPEDAHLAGNSVSVYDLKQVISSDSIKVNLIAVFAIFMVLVLSFRSFRIPLILTLGIEGSIWINMTIPYLTGSHLFYIGYLVVSSILLGATVDYAILVTGRFRENLSQSDCRDAILSALKTSSISVFTSSSILITAGILLYFLCTNQLIAQLGLLLARGAFLAVLMVIFVLPACLQLQHKIK